MVRRALFTLAGVFIAATLMTAATEVTFVLTSGQRVSGIFSYNHTDHYQLIVNGQEKDYPSDDIAMISFGAGDPEPGEVAMLPTAANPPELQRHMIVLKSGEVLRGKIYDFKNDQITMDMGPNDRRTFDMSGVARLYINAQAARTVYGVTESKPIGPVGPASSSGSTAQPSGASKSVEVPANQTWVDTGLYVNKGDSVWFTVTGQVYMSQSQRVGPDGVPNSLNRKDNPLPSANSGALLGRVGNQMFLIGTTTDPISIPASGRLMLGINDDNHRDNRDAFQVTIRR